jgi:hypothetical protein
LLQILAVPIQAIPFREGFTRQSNGRVNPSRKESAQVFSLLEHYYRRQQIKPATRYFVEELFAA